MATLNQVLSGLHETDKKIYNAVGLSSVQRERGDSGPIIPLLDGAQFSGRINPAYNSLKVASMEDNAGIDQLSKIKFIGNCAVKKGADGELIIRIGENLNSSPFNTEEGTTNGMAHYTVNPTSSLIVGGEGNVAKTLTQRNRGNQTITISPSDLIHLDDIENTHFYLNATIPGSDTPVTADFGPITTNGYYANESAPVGSVPANSYLHVTNLKDETNKSKGATGYEANVEIVLKLATMNIENQGDINFTISSTGTDGAVNYSVSPAVYYIYDINKKPSVNSVSAILPPINSTNTQTWAGITSFKYGKVTYKATFADLNNPATNKSNGANITFDNTQDFCGDFINATVTQYSGEITKETVNNATHWNNGAYPNIGDAILAIGFNINGSTTAYGKVYASNGTPVSGIDVYKGSVDASITNTRRKADGTNYNNAGNAAAGDLMLYHGALQKPVTNVTSSFIGCETYVQPAAAENLSALFEFDASATEPGGTLIINGLNLTDGIVSIKLGNSKDNLKDIKNKGGEAINDSKSETDSQLSYTYVFQKDTDYVTGSKHCWIQIIYSSSSTAQITSISRS